MSRAASRILVSSVAAAVVLAAAPAAAEPVRADRVVVFALPGVTWTDVDEVRPPNLLRLIDGGASAAMSVRAAARHTNPARGYLTLGAGNRAYVRGTDRLVHVALGASEPYENGTAAEALARRTGVRPRGEIVHINFGRLMPLQRRLRYGTAAGALGATLARAGVRRAVVTAADFSPTPTPEEMRREAVLALADRTGSVDTGTLSGLLAGDPAAPYGVRTDRAAIDAAVAAAMDAAQVVLVDPGETLRADEFARTVSARQGRLLEAEALRRADAILGDVTRLLGPRDVLLVVAPSGQTERYRESLTPLVAYGGGVASGKLSSASTGRAGLATLSDVGPTILDALGLDAHPSMSGTAVQVEAGDAEGNAGELARLTTDSVRREVVAPLVAVSFIAFLGVLALLAFVVFLTDPPRRLVLVLAAFSLFLLAVPPAAAIARATFLFDLSPTAGVVAMYALAVALACLVAVVPGPRWTGGVILLVLSAVLAAGDLLAGAPWQLNGVFGYSPIVAGRFYGASNLGWTILYSAVILGFTGLYELRRKKRAPWTFAIVLAAMLIVTGLPMFGANFGGFLGGVPAAFVAFAVARDIKIRGRFIAAAAASAVVLTLGLLAWDLSRPPEVRTHIGRFGARVLSGGVPALLTVIRRKAEANIGLLGTTVWTVMIPIGLAVLFLLLWRPRGVLRPAMARHTLMRSGLVGALAAGLFGFVVNDSGIAIPSMVLAHVVPLIVLMGAQEVVPRGGGRDVVTRT